MTVEQDPRKTATPQEPRNKSTHPGLPTSKSDSKSTTVVPQFQELEKKYDANQRAIDANNLLRIVIENQDKIS